MVAEVTLNNPAIAWKEARGWFGGGAMPLGWEMLVTSGLDLPVGASSLIDAGVPLVGVLLEPDSGGLRAVVGVHLRSGRELVSLLTKGASAPFAASAQPAGLSLITAKTGSSGPALGVLGDYLLVSRESGALRNAAAYVVQKLGRRRGDVEPSLVIETQGRALGHVLADALRAGWRDERWALDHADQRNRRARGGREPDFGDPTEVLAVLDEMFGAAMSMLQSVDAVRVDVHPSPEGVTLKARIGFVAQSATGLRVAALSVGSMHPLLELPVQTVAAVLVQRGRDDATARAVADTVARVLGDRLGPRDRARLEKTAAAWSRSIGDSSTWGLLDVEGSRAVFAQAPLTDETQFTAAMEGSLELVRLPTFSDPFASLVGRPHVVGPAKLDQHARRADIRFSERELRDSDPKLEIVWTTTDRARLVVAPFAADRAVASLAEPDTTLASEAAVSALAHDHPTDVAFAAAARLAAPRQGDYGWLALAAGRSGQTVWLDFRGEQPALSALVAAAMGD